MFNSPNTLLVIATNDVIFKPPPRVSFFYIQEKVQSKVIWEEPRRKVPTGYNGTPQIQPQSCSFPSTMTTAI